MKIGVSLTSTPRWVVFDFLGVILPLGVSSGLSYMGIHTRQAVDEEIIKLMRDLELRGASLALASNSGKAWIESVWKKIEKAPKIDKLITPEMGAIKPESAYFRHLIAEVRAKPSEIFFIDDRQANCIGARQEGIDAFWYRGEILPLRKKLGLE